MAVCALLAVVLCFAAPDVRAGESAPLAGNVVYLGGQRAKELKMPVVAFDHAAHAKANACASCHAAAPGVEKNSAGLPVNIMQTPVFSAFAGVASSDKDERKMAFHAACATCHAQKGVGPSLAQCRNCHSVDDTAQLPVQALQAANGRLAAPAASDLRGLSGQAAGGAGCGGHYGRE